jgi:DNA-directed RNA polymerase subunit RPC12/RpoP
MTEFKCKGCGAIFTKEDEKMPNIACTCESEEFVINS